MPVSGPTRHQIRSQFADHEFAEVVRLLEQYGAREHDREMDRVHAAVLELAEGSVAKVKDLVAAALADYRDVLYWPTFDEDGNPPPLPVWNTDDTPKVPPDIPAELHDCAIALIVCENPDYEPRQVALNPTREETARHIDELPWNEITYVVARIDDHHWLEGSGSLSPEDGLSAACHIGDADFVSLDAPKSLDQIVELIDSFVQRDGEWRQMIDWC